MDFRTCDTEHVQTTRLNKGFSLVELIVTVAVFVGVLIISVRVFSNFRTVEVLSKEGDRVESLIREARDRTLSGQSDSKYGVYATSDGLQLFSGDVYSPGAVEKTIQYNGLVTMSSSDLGESSIVFQRLTGKVATSGAFTLSLVNSSETIDFEISTSGALTRIDN